MYLGSNLAAIDWVLGVSSTFERVLILIGESIALSRSLLIGKTNFSVCNRFGDTLYFIWGLLFVEPSVFAYSCLCAYIGIERWLTNLDYVVL